MTYTGRIDRDWDQAPVKIRRLLSVTEQAFDAVTEAVCAVPGRWAVERHDDYEGHLFILISPEDDANAPTYVVSGDVDHVELAQFQNDQLRSMGRFETLEAALVELVRALIRLDLPN